MWLKIISIINKFQVHNHLSKINFISCVFICFYQWEWRDLKHNILRFDLELF